MTHAKDRLVTFQWLGVARRGFLNVGIINIRGLGFFVVGGFPVQFLSSAPGLYPLDAFSTPPLPPPPRVLATKTPPDIAQCALGGR